MRQSQTRADGPPPPSARDRLLAAAARLFYTEGINSTGVDRVAVEAGVTKATLYNNFRSKEALVVACLRRQLENWSAAVQGVDRASADAAVRVGAFFDLLARDALDPDYRGCAFTNAAVEVPDSEAVMAVVGEYRERLGRHVAGLVGDCDPEVADTVVFLHDGAMVAVKTTHDPDHVARAKAAALRLLSDCVSSATDADKRPR